MPCVSQPYYVQPCCLLRQPWLASCRGKVNSQVMAALGKEAKDGFVQGFDEVGQSVGDGLFDHANWRCIGTFGVFAEKGRLTGMCVSTDLGGDQVIAQFATTDPVPISDKERHGTCELIGGTGKYAGITGSFSFIVHPQEFPFPALAAPNHYTAHNTYEGTYKLP
jgi:hypothetical protein